MTDEWLGGHERHRRAFAQAAATQVGERLAHSGEDLPLARRKTADLGLADERADLLGVASRDVRLLALAVGAALGQCWWTLVVVAALSYATVAWRLWAFRRRAEPSG